MKSLIKRLLRFLPSPLYRQLRRLYLVLGSPGQRSYTVQPGPFITQVYARLNTIEGWFKLDDAYQFSLLLNQQTLLGVQGDILEIGCYQGRSTALLALHLQPDERLVVCDVFDLPVAEPYIPTPTAQGVQANLEQAVPTLSSAALTIHRCHSRELLLPAEARFRFVHVDGDHSETACRHDLDLAARHLLLGGLIVVDDYQHPDHPGVTAAVTGFLAVNADIRLLGDVNRGGAVGRKLYLGKGQPNRSAMAALIGGVTGPVGGDAGG